jgi:hypothetical protein
MQVRSRSSSVFLYLGTVAAALSVIALSSLAVVKSSAGTSASGPREKTLLDLQVESSREIRRALATPVTYPPLPPITARPRRDLREIAAAHEKRPAHPKLSPAALNAMAMDQSGINQSAMNQSDMNAQNYPVFDRHKIY